MNCWNKSETATVLKTLSIIINGQKAYGKEYSVKDTFAYYELKLGKKYSADQVIYALDKYTDTRNDIPAPSDIINILNPEEPKISATEYMAAKEQWQLNGYPMFCKHRDIVKKYESQASEKQNDHTIECAEIAKIAGNSIKRMT